MTNIYIQAPNSKCFRVYGQYLILMIMLMTISVSQAQESTISLKPNDQLEVADQLFFKDLHAAAFTHYESFIENNPLESKPNLASDLRYAHSQRLLSLIRMDDPRIERYVDEFLLGYYPAVESKKMLIEAGNWAYNNKLYEQAVEYYDRLIDFELNQEQYSEVSFKRGYCHFVRKEFDLAKYHLGLTKEISNQYYYPSNYYYGMCQYFDENYEEAIQSFKKVSAAQKYKSQVPYYIAQIYFAQSRYQELIQYGEVEIKNPKLEKSTEIQLLMGQAHFQLNQYEDAIGYLEYYEQNTKELTKKEFYQLAFTQYKLKQCDKAIKNFSELVNLKDKMGQVVNYYLADCFLKSGDKQSARSAFKKVSQMDFDQSMKKESEFNYGKLSAELGFDREAINNLMAIDGTSAYYKKAQDIVGDILLRTTDYANGIRILDEIASKSPKLKEIYQRISVYRAIQHYNDKNYDDALASLKKSMTYPISRSLEIEAKYWTANIYQQQGQVDESIDQYDEYFVLANGAKDVPQESSSYLAHYQQGYNYFEKENYGAAELQFKSAVTGIEINQESIKDPIISNRIYSDALVRMGDCEFKYNKYDKALKHYEKATYTKNPSAAYALYQQATIEGLKNKPYDQIITLESITEQYPSSEYADNAYYDLGNTYIQLDKIEPAFRAFEAITVKYRGKSDLINESYLKMGLLSYNQGDSRKAIEYYKKIFDLNPSSNETTQAVLALEEIYISDLGKPNEYAAFLDSIPGYELSTYDQDSLTYHVGYIKYEDAVYGEAIGQFNQYLNQYPTGVYAMDARYYRAESNLLMKNYKVALQDYEYIVSKGRSDRYNSAAKKAAVISYNHALDFENAYKYYDLLAEAAVDPNIKHEAASGALASAFRVNNESAIMKYAQLIRQDNLSSAEEISTASYYLGKVSFKQKNYDQAIIAFNDVISRSNNNQAAESSYLISKIYFMQNKYDLSEEQCNKTNVNSGSYPIWVARSLLLLSDIYVVKEDLFNARAALEAVLENFNTNPQIVVETNEKLALISAMEGDKNRIKAEPSNNLIQLDTTNNGN